jgi:DNA (cytosine-5)-methyltransferase 1
MTVTKTHEIVVDNFAGGGGASLGIERAIGRPVDFAINHDPMAIAIHQANHPNTYHYCEDVWKVDPREVGKGRRVGLAWFSPDCTHFSRAKGGKPVKRNIRALAWVVIRWAKLRHPRVIILENVAEFQTWGPLTKDSRPCPKRKGATFKRWLTMLRRLGYEVEYRELVAADYGAPTTRKRFFLIARSDGKPIVWPKPTHGPGRGKPWRTAAECIDWSMPCPSIFDRKKALAENTLKRIAKGIDRFVVHNPKPFIVTYYGTHPGRDDVRAHDVNEPLRTQSTENRFGLCTPYVVKCNHKYEQFRGQSLEQPLQTQTAENQFAIATPFHGVVAAHLTKFYGTTVGSQMDLPMPTITGGGWHLGEVRAFLVKYYGCGIGQSVSEPMHTVTSKDRMGLVTVEGEEFQIVDIGLRMLQPRELARAQGFPDTYKFRGSNSAQVASIGNSVPPDDAEALVKANYSEADAMEGVA